MFDVRREGWLFPSTQRNSREYCSPAGMFTVLLCYGYTSVNCDQRLLYFLFACSYSLILSSSLGFLL